MDSIGGNHVRGNQCNYGSVVGRDYFCLSVKVGFGIVTLELGELVGAYASYLFEGMSSKPCEASLDILEIVVGAEKTGFVKMLGSYGLYLFSTSKVTHPLPLYKVLCFCVPR